MKINDYLTQHCVVREVLPGLSMRELAPRVVCKDGFEMSVQVGHTHYCRPRVDRAIYSAVEVGYPSALEELLMPYVEDEKTPTETVVYGYVPVEIVNQVIKKHGGLANNEAA